MTNPKNTEHVEEAKVLATTPIEQNAETTAPPAPVEPTNASVVNVESSDYLLKMAAAVESSTKLEKMEPVMTLTAEYIELQKPGESFKGVYVGTQEMKLTNKATGEQRDYEAARFIINKQIWINAGAALISEIKRANIPVGTALLVTYTEKKGNTKIYSITLLG